MSMLYVLTLMAPLFAQFAPEIYKYDFKDMTREDMLAYAFLALTVAVLLWFAYMLLVKLPEAIIRVAAMVVVSVMVVGMCVTPEGNQCARYSVGIMSTLRDLWNMVTHNTPAMAEKIKTNFQ